MVQRYMWYPMKTAQWDVSLGDLVLVLTISDSIQLCWQGLAMSMNMFKKVDNATSSVSNVISILVLVIINQPR
jgi:hypothetical protein